MKRIEEKSQQNGITHLQQEKSARARFRTRLQERKIRRERQKIKKEWEKIEQKLRMGISQLDRKELNILLTSSIAYDQHLGVNYLLPNMPTQLKKKTTFLINKYGTISPSVMFYIKAWYQGRLRITVRPRDIFL